MSKSIKIKIERYPNPAQVLNWAGYIEPEDEKWILWFKDDGETAFFPERDENGGIIEDDGLRRGPRKPGNMPPPPPSCSTAKAAESFTRVRSRLGFLASHNLRNNPETIYLTQLFVASKGFAWEDLDEEQQGAETGAMCVILDTMIHAMGRAAPIILDVLQKEAASFQRGELPSSMATICAMSD
jgi:hypothetical protein